MAKNEVDDYLAGLDPLQRQALESLRRAILAVVPDAEQGLSYGVPAFKVGGKVVAGFAAAKHHLSYLPHSGSVLQELADDVADYDVTKGALKFSADAPLPDDLVAKLIAARRRELGQLG